MLNLILSLAVLWCQLLLVSAEHDDHSDHFLDQTTAVPGRYKDQCLYDSDCRGGSRICLDGLCECFLDTQIWNSEERQCVAGIAGKLISEDDDEGDRYKAIALAVGLAACFVGLSVGIAIGITKYRNSSAAALTERNNQTAKGKGIDRNVDRKDIIQALAFIQKDHNKQQKLIILQQGERESQYSSRINLKSSFTSNFNKRFSRQQSHVAYQQ